MSVKLTSPALGQDVGDIYTGPEEDWLLAEGYAKRDADTTPTSYTGPGVSNTGATDVVPAEDPGLAANRESPVQAEPWHLAHGPLDPAMIDPSETEKAATEDPKRPENRYDFDEGGVNDEAPTLASVDPETGAAGDEVTLTGVGFEGVTAVTFDAVAATSFEVVDDSTITAVLPAHADGAVDVVVTNPTGSDTLVGGFTYAA